MYLSLSARIIDRLRSARLPASVWLSLGGALLFTLSYAAHPQDQNVDLAFQLFLEQMDVDHDGTVSQHEFGSFLKYRALQTMRKLDRDGDQALSLAEFTAPSDSGFHPAFASLDTDGNGVATEDEYAAVQRRQHKANLERKYPDRPQVQAPKYDSATAYPEFIRSDLNGDGRLTASEHMAFRRQVFQRTDADENGRLSEAEINTEFGRFADSLFCLMDRNGNGAIEAVDIRRDR